MELTLGDFLKIMSASEALGIRVTENEE